MGLEVDIARDGNEKGDWLVFLQAEMKVFAVEDVHQSMACGSRELEGSRQQSPCRV